MVAKVVRNLWAHRGARRLFAFAYLAVCVQTPRSLAVATDPTVEWIRQFGTSGRDFSYGVSVDALGNGYVTGYTTGALSGLNMGDRDAFIRKYDPSGNLLWTRQLGSSELDISFAVAASSSAVYMSGVSYGNVGAPSAGSADAFLSRFDDAGSLQWTRQIGTGGFDIGFGVSSDGAGAAYMTGTTTGSLARPSLGKTDAFLAKYDAGGVQLWNRQFGTIDDDSSAGAAADSLGNVFVAGGTYGNFAGPNAGSYDAIVSKFDGLGNRLWSRQIGTANYDQASAVAAGPAGEVYITGYTEGNLASPISVAGNRDVFVVKLDADGNSMWTRQIGASSMDEAFGIAVDSLGNAYVTGYADNLDFGDPPFLRNDVFLAKFDPSGTLDWWRRIATSADERGQGVAAYGVGSVFVSGYTQGSLSGPASGEEDAFIVKYAVAEPSTGAMDIVVCIGLRATRRGKS